MTRRPYQTAALLVLWLDRFAGALVRRALGRDGRAAVALRLLGRPVRRALLAIRLVVSAASQRLVPLDPQLGGARRLWRRARASLESVSLRSPAPSLGRVGTAQAAWSGQGDWRIWSCFRLRGGSSGSVVSRQASLGRAPYHHRCPGRLARGWSPERRAGRFWDRQRCAPHGFDHGSGARARTDGCAQGGNVQSAARVMEILHEQAEGAIPWREDFGIPSSTRPRCAIRQGPFSSGGSHGHRWPQAGGRRGPRRRCRGVMHVRSPTPGSQARSASGPRVRRARHTRLRGGPSSPE
jgi:hypothetical protein